MFLKLIFVYVVCLGICLGLLVLLGLRNSVEVGCGVFGVKHTNAGVIDIEVESFGNEEERRGYC